MLSDAQKYHGNPRGMHHTDQRPDHIPDGIAFADDEAVHADAVVAKFALQQRISVSGCHSCNIWAYGMRCLGDPGQSGK